MTIPQCMSVYLALSPRPNLLSRDGIEMTPGVRCTRDKRAGSAINLKSPLVSPFIDHTVEKSSARRHFIETGSRL